MADRIERVESSATETNFQDTDLEHYDIRMDCCCCCLDTKPRNFQNTKPSILCRLWPGLPIMFVVGTVIFVIIVLFAKKILVPACILYALFLLFVIVNVGWIVYHVIPICCLKKRKFTKSHDLTLKQILRETYGFIPTINELKKIDEKSRNYLNIVRGILEKSMGFSTMEMFLAGSSAERFCIPLSKSKIEKGTGLTLRHALLSDVDYMISPSTEIASFTKNFGYYFINCSSNDGNINLMPGFVYIFENEHHTMVSAKSVKEEILQTVERLRLGLFSGTTTTTVHCCCFAHDMDQNKGQVQIKGPTIEIQVGSHLDFIDKFYADMTFSLKCPEWPGQISNWASREKKWPSERDVDRITGFGCHFVPKSQEDDTDENSWRISFSKAEVELSKMVPIVARACFIGIKVIAKDYLSVICLLSSYTLKSIFFHCLEKTDPGIWTQGENLEICFDILLEAITDSIRRQWCPHFWIPTINLFVDLKTKEVGELLHKLQKIKVKPSQCIEQFTLPDEDVTKPFERSKLDDVDYDADGEPLIIDESSDEEEANALMYAILKAGRKNYAACV